jgi:hypothetical protein
VQGARGGSSRATATSATAAAAKPLASHLASASTRPTGSRVRSLRSRVPGARRAPRFCTRRCQDASRAPGPRRRSTPRRDISAGANGGRRQSPRASSAALEVPLAGEPSWSTASSWAGSSSRVHSGTWVTQTQSQPVAPSTARVTAVHALAFAPVGCESGQGDLEPDWAAANPRGVSRIATAVNEEPPT